MQRTQIPRPSAGHSAAARNKWGSGARIKSSSITNTKPNDGAENIESLCRKYVSLNMSQTEIETLVLGANGVLSSTLRQDIWLMLNGNALCEHLCFQHSLLQNGFSWNPASHGDNSTLGLTDEVNLRYLRRKIESGIDEVLNSFEKPDSMQWGNKIRTFARWEYLKDEIVPLYNWFKKQKLGGHQQVQEEMLRRYGSSFPKSGTTNMGTHINKWLNIRKHPGLIHTCHSTHSTPWTELATPRSATMAGDTPVIYNPDESDDLNPTNDAEPYEDFPPVPPLRILNGATVRNQKPSIDDRESDTESRGSHRSNAESIASTIKTIEDAAAQGFNHWSDDTFATLVPDGTSSLQYRDQNVEDSYSMHLGSKTRPTIQGAVRKEERPPHPHQDSGIELDDDMENQNYDAHILAANLQRNNSAGRRPSPIPLVPDPLFFLTQNSHSSQRLKAFSSKSAEGLRHYSELRELSQTPAPAIPRQLSLHALARTIYTTSYDETMFRLSQALLYYDPLNDYEPNGNTPGHTLLSAPRHHSHAEFTTRFWLETWLNFPSTQRHISINAQNADGDTMLHLASRHGFYLVVDELLRRGAALDFVNKAYRAPLGECKGRAAGGNNYDDGSSAPYFNCMKMLQVAMNALKI